VPRVGQLKETVVEEEGLRSADYQALRIRRRCRRLSGGCVAKMTGSEFRDVWKFAWVGIEVDLSICGMFYWRVAVLCML
jgi:hypothetical protein